MHYAAAVSSSLFLACPSVGQCSSAAKVTTRSIVISLYHDVLPTRCRCRKGKCKETPTGHWEIGNGLLLPRRAPSMFSRKDVYFWRWSLTRGIQMRRWLQCPIALLEKFLGNSWVLSQKLVSFVFPRVSPCSVEVLQALPLFLTDRTTLICHRYKKSLFPY